LLVLIPHARDRFEHSAGVVNKWIFPNNQILNGAKAWPNSKFHGTFFSTNFTQLPGLPGREKPLLGSVIFPRKGFMHQLCLVYPILTVSANQGIFQKSKDRQFQRFSQLTCGRTEVPLVYIQGVILAELADPDGV
jgi:hypothetical protein